MVACPWRIIAEGRIALTDTDHLQKFGLPAPIDGPTKAREILSNKTIVSLWISSVSGDIQVTFEGAVNLELFSYSSGYESWQASGDDGDRRSQLIAMGGGEIAVFSEALDRSGI